MLKEEVEKSTVFFLVLVIFFCMDIYYLSIRFCICKDEENLIISYYDYYFIFNYIN